ncbi:MAG: hydrogenase maturation nickel metallochaperone HypA [Thermoproteota archaeon]|nr:hydrogenase maturation nickel metallochaperone HypA [Thermoproteota archaeon]
MNIDDDTKRFIIHRLIWFAFFMGVGFILVFLIPFPLDIVSVAILFILTYYLRSRSEMKKFGVRDLFGSFSSAFNDQYRPLKYYCMSCGKEHKKMTCPNCGSKMKRAG